MKIKIRAHSGSSKEEIKELVAGGLEIWFKEKPLNNKANIALIKILEKHFNKEVKIKSGFSSREKTVEVFD